MDILQEKTIKRWAYTIIPQMLFNLYAHTRINRDVLLQTISRYSLASDRPSTTFLAVDNTDEIPTVLAASVKQSLA